MTSQTAAERMQRAAAERPRVLIEEWLPAAAIGVECMRERGSASALAPTTFLHVWWARRPLTVSRAAVLGSLLPADFPRDTFERLLGFGRPSEDLVTIRRMIDGEIPDTRRSPGFGCGRAFTTQLRDEDLGLAHEAMRRTWQGPVAVIDPMSGGGSIPLEANRLGLRTLANEYNPVACTVLEATINLPFRFSADLAARSARWGKELHKRFVQRVERFFPTRGAVPAAGYIFARTVPCPDTGYPTPLVPDWSLLKPKGGYQVVAVPVVDKATGAWRIEVKGVGRGAGEVRTPPTPTYDRGKGISLFTGRQIPADYIKAKAAEGQLGSVLYAIAVKRPKLEFEPPLPEDLEALAGAEQELARLRAGWEREGIIPTERFPEVTTDPRPRVYGMPRWADMFSPRQLLCMGVLVEELRALRPEIVSAEGEEAGDAIVHLLAFALDKFANYNCYLSSWHAPREVLRSVFDRHDFAFKATFAETASTVTGMGLDWAIGNVLDAWEKIAELPRDPNAKPAEITLGSATSLPHLDDGSVTAVIVDPPYADNVQYSELADFFYVWLKRTVGYQHPEWFATYLCEHDEEAVVNAARFRMGGKKKAAEAKQEAHAFYHRLMVDVFRECRRILRDDGVLTVMFTHKQQEAWADLFSALIAAGFTITATWPVKTESEHSLHQAQKNAAQSTVLLVCRKRAEGAGTGYFDRAMRREVAEAARSAAARLKGEGLNAVDQLVGAFGPAVAVFSRYDTVKTDVGIEVGVEEALDEAADAVARWRIEQLTQRGLEGVEPEGRFALLCWDVLGAAQFRFNEAKLLGHAAGMDVDRLADAGLVEKSGDKVRMLSAKERRRAGALDALQSSALLAPLAAQKKGAKKDLLLVHPNDPLFRTALDGCHALALAYAEAGGGPAGIGAARAIATRQRWSADSPVAKLMEALVHAAPPALRVDPKQAGARSAAAHYPEFAAWHALLTPLFGVEPPDWSPKTMVQASLLEAGDGDDEPEEDEP